MRVQVPGVISELLAGIVLGPSLLSWAVLKDDGHHHREDYGCGQELKNNIFGIHGRSPLPALFFGTERRFFSVLIPAAQDGAGASGFRGDLHGHESQQPADAVFRVKGGEYFVTCQCCLYG